MEYENELYKVSINESNDGYNVINKENGIIEFQTEIKPEAIKLATLFNAEMSRLTSPDTPEDLSMTPGTVIN